MPGEEQFFNTKTEQNTYKGETSTQTQTVVGVQTRTQYNPEITQTTIAREDIGVVVSFRVPIRGGFLSNGNNPACP